MGKAVLLPVSTVWGGAYLALAGDNLAIWPYMPAYSYLKPALNREPGRYHITASQTALVSMVLTCFLVHGTVCGLV